ncbi:hypothetical protein RCC89_10705 [Cytophagaceae bacterium ABcell3]|nr:hypothetical protein RCC89_10705 [Cytophagaceae bacterium ABcell3]
MLQGTENKKLPSLYAILPYFVLSSLSLLVVMVLLYYTGTEVRGHYFQPKLLAVTHVATLGLITPIIFGSLLMILPVVLEVRVYSEKLSAATFILLVSGLPLLTYAFWNFQAGPVMQVGGVMVFLSLSIFCINFFLSVRDCQKWKIEADLISSSVIWLFITALIGTLLVFNFSYAFIPVSHLEMLKIHANLGLAGWFFMLIAGVSSRLIPMFLLVHNVNTDKLKFTWYTGNAGLAALAVAFYFELPAAYIFVCSLFVVAAVVFYIFFMLEVYRKRFRKGLDTGMKLTFYAFIFLGVSIVLGSLSPFSFLKEEYMMLVRVAFGFAVLLGFCGVLVVGQGIKILPFIIWTYKYKDLAGKGGVPLPKDLVSERLSRYTMGGLLIGLLGVFASIVFGYSLLMSLSCGVLIVTALLHNINMFKAILHKPYLKNMR